MAGSHVLRRSPSGGSEMFGSQSAAAGAPMEEDGGGAPASSPAPTGSESASMAARTTPASEESSIPAALSPSSPSGDTQIVDTAPDPAPERDGVETITEDRRLRPSAGMRYVSAKRRRPLTGRIVEAGMEAVLTSTP
jgi:hypothetical protein